MGQDYVDEARRTGRTADSGIQFRLQSVSEDLSLAYIQSIAEDTHTPAAAVSYILIDGLGGKCNH
jgi:hypothetical protein